MAIQRKNRSKYPGHRCITTSQGNVQAFKIWIWMICDAHVPIFAYLWSFEISGWILFYQRLQRGIVNMYEMMRSI